LSVLLPLNHWVIYLPSVLHYALIFVSLLALEAVAENSSRPTALLIAVKLCPAAYKD
jgi:hypothetical protein